MIFMVMPDYEVEVELLKRLRKKQKTAMVEVYEQYFIAIYNYIHLKIGHVQIAEDLAGDVFLALIEALHTNKFPRTNLRGWLFAVARNHIAQYYQTTEKMIEINFDEWIVHAPSNLKSVNLENLMIENIDLDKLIQALQALSAEQQDVIILRFGQSLNLRETADIMGKSISAIKSLQFRAILGLRRILQGD